MYIFYLKSYVWLNKGEEKLGLDKVFLDGFDIWYRIWFKIIVYYFICR